MAHRKYELKIVIVIDDTIQSAVDSVNDVKNEILSEESQQELLNESGFISCVATFEELNN